MKFTLELPDEIHRFMTSFRDNGYEIFVVGGSVRDMLLGKRVKDWDFTTSAKPENILDLFPDAKYENTFGTVLITPSAQLKDGPEAGWTFNFEITPFRKEGRYSDNRHPDEIEWAETVEEDLKRRDFTINALAYDGSKLVDISRGQQDLKEKIIRAVGDPSTRFQEDALRMLRAIRFSAQLGFDIEPTTFAAIQQEAPRIKNISWERINDEFLKILSVESSEDAADAILLLKESGLLQQTMPELTRCFGVEQKSPGRHHTDDVGTHLIKTLRHCPSSNPIVRFAALIHDIGKAETRDVDKRTGITTFYNHEIVGAQIAHTIARRFRLSKKQHHTLVTLVRYHMFSVGENQTDKALRRFIRRVGKEHIKDMLDIRTGDRIGSGVPATSWRTELFKKRLVEVQKRPFEVRDLKIGGDDVMKELDMKAGPKIGTILKELFEKVADGTLPNDRETLLTHLRQDYSSEVQAA